MSFCGDDHRFMARALALAERGLFTTTPNPRVGCVLVSAGEILGEGWHERAGQPHAEINALKNIGAGRTAQGATAYVTLEPCSHHGRTPPCANALIDAGVARVVAALRDPNPLVAGQGLARLAEAGLRVECGLMEQAAQELNIGFISRMTRGRPWLRLKIAASLDGKTALLNGKSQWITSNDARRHAHAWRARSCAVLTGSGTVQHDDPRLDVREVATDRQPRPIIVSGRLDLPLNARILERQPLIFTATLDTRRKRELLERGAELVNLPDATGKVDLARMLMELGSRGFNELLVEGGPGLNGALLAAGLVDELLIYQAPLLIGHQARGMVDLPALTDLAAAHRLDIVDRRSIGADLFLRARLS